MKRRCEVCRGRGLLVVEQRGWYETTVDCDCCDATGQVEDDEHCDCGQVKRHPEDRQCPSCQAADDSDEAYERSRDEEQRRMA